MVLEKTQRSYLNESRHLVESVIGQLAEQLNMNKMWILFGRLDHNIMSHGLGILANTLQKIDPYNLNM